MADESSALVPGVVREIDFYGDALLIGIVDEVPYVALRPIADFLGLDWSAQYRRVLRDDVLAAEAQLVIMTGADGKPHNMFSLPLEFLPGWLFGITPSRITRPEVLPKIMRYRRECFRFLWQSVQKDLLSHLSTPSGSVALELLPHDVTQYEELIGVTNLVREHVEILTETVNPMTEKVDYMVYLLETLVGHQQATEKRVARIEQHTQRLTPGHARTVAELVDQMVRRTAASAGPLAYYKIYGQLKQHFRTNSYKDLPDERFGEVMEYLRGLLRQSLGSDLPHEDTPI